jgi:nitrate/nitrite transporter NarK
MTRLGPSDVPAASPDHAEAARPGVIGLGVALTLGMGVSTFIAFALGSLAPFLRVEFGLSRTQIGALTTTLFAVGSSASPLAGRAVDSLGGRRTLHLLFAAGAAS